MKNFLISVDPAAAKFYETVAKRTGTSTEKLMASVLFKFAGELSVKAAREKQKPKN